MMSIYIYILNSGKKLWILSTNLSSIAKSLLFQLSRLSDTNIQCFEPFWLVSSNAEEKHTNAEFFWQAYHFSVEFEANVISRRKPFSWNTWTCSTVCIAKSNGIYKLIGLYDLSCQLGCFCLSTSKKPKTSGFVVSRSFLSQQRSQLFFTCFLLLEDGVFCVDATKTHWLKASKKSYGW